MSICPRVDDAILYSLQQLAGEEARAFAAHADECPACRLKLAELHETLDLLPLAAASVTPPPDLKGRVLNRLAAEMAADPARSRRWRLVPVWAAAALLALAMGASALVSVQGLRERLAGFQQAARLEQVVSLTGTADAPRASGRLTVAPETGGTRIALEAQGLPPLEPGEAYQLWLIKDGKRRSGGVFVVDGTGAGGVAAWLPGSVEFDALGITREPDPLGQQPRGPKVMGSI